MASNVVEVKSIETGFYDIFMFYLKSTQNNLISSGLVAQKNKINLSTYTVGHFDENINNKIADFFNQTLKKPMKKVNGRNLNTLLKIFVKLIEYQCIVTNFIQKVKIMLH